jgi:para-nitrobenzyl esterase
VVEIATAKTTAGLVRGRRDGAVSVFLGVPYAAPPVGDLRFAAPAPHAAWDGERDATQPGPTAPQFRRPFTAIDISALVGDGWAKGDDYLTANIWTPDPAATGLPVLVFIHGGAFVGGCNNAVAQDGTGFARSGVVCVTINYRLGVEGFLVLDGAPTNLGLRDQLAALAWVRDNIAAFGGDPANVTVAGESAGAMSVADLVASPLAKGLFRRAIVESGHGSMVRPAAVARRVTEKIAGWLGVAPTAEGFRGRTVEDGLAMVDKAQLPTTRIDLRDGRGRDSAYGLSRFLPVWGDDVLPQRPLDALAAGAGAEVELLIGTNREEMNLYFVPTGVKAKMGRLLSWLFLRRMEPQAGAVLRAYRKRMPAGARPGDVLGEVLNDLVFRLPARRFAAAHQGRTHLYEFDWRSPAFGGELGACHALEIPFAFDTLATCAGEKAIAGPSPPQELADRVHAIWVGFASDGSLPWPAYDAKSRIVYSLAGGTVAPDAPMAAEAFAS